MGGAGEVGEDGVPMPTEPEAAVWAFIGWSGAEAAEEEEEEEEEEEIDDEIDDGAYDDAYANDAAGTGEVELVAAFGSADALRKAEVAGRAFFGAGASARPVSALSSGQQVDSAPPHIAPHLAHLGMLLLLAAAPLDHLTSPHLTSPHLTSSHRTSPHLTAPHSPRHAPATRSCASRSPSRLPAAPRFSSSMSRPTTSTSTVSYG